MLKYVINVLLLNTYHKKAYSHKNLSFDNFCVYKVKITVIVNFLVFRN